MRPSGCRLPTVRGRCAGRDLASLPGRSTTGACARPPAGVAGGAGPGCEPDLPSTFHPSLRGFLRGKARGRWDRDAAVMNPTRRHGRSAAHRAVHPDQRRPQPGPHDRMRAAIHPFGGVVVQGAMTSGCWTPSSLTARATTTAARSDKPVTTLATQVTNQAGITVLDGAAVVWRDPVVAAASTVHSTANKKTPEPPASPTRGNTDEHHHHREPPHQRGGHRDAVRDPGRRQGPARDRQVPVPGHEHVARRDPQPVELLRVPRRDAGDGAQARHRGRRGPPRRPGRPGRGADAGGVPAPRHRGLPDGRASPTSRPLAGVELRR